ncbi:MAG: serpin family protein [Myxococcales bacterium]|nr:serpin family protein [Myxococcales bacterium]
MRPMRCLILFSVVVALCGCSGGDGRLPVPGLGQRELSLLEASNQFGFSLFAKVIEHSDGGNVFISPLSVSMALGMTENGAAGETLTAMKATLGHAGLTDEEINRGYRTLIDYLTRLDPHVKMEIANSIWYRQGLAVLPSFIEINRAFFDALVAALDFDDPSAADTINAWVSAATHGRIDKIVAKPIDPALVMFLINAVYFKGDWTYRFDKSATTPAAFHGTRGEVEVPMMNLHDDELAYLDDGDVQILDLPYGDGKFAMAFLLPAPEQTVDQLAASLTPERWAGWMARLIPQEGDVFLPRFELTFETTLKSVLSALGMEIAFDAGRADFSRILAEGGLFISEVRHKSYVRVDEEGTEAAAVTSVEVGITSVPASFVFRADRPFLYLLHERASGALLFLGKLVDPSAS